MCYLSELMDHYGWKWWKQQSADREQVVLELIDIWHFGLSVLLETGRAVGDISTELANALAFIEDNKLENQDVKAIVEDFTLSTLKTKSFDEKLFFKLMKSINLGFEDLYRGYVGKNVLNFFRQDNGYKDGSYKKVWQGKEDNEHLVEAVKLLDSESSTFKDDVYCALKKRYASA